MKLTKSLVSVLAGVAAVGLVARAGHASERGCAVGCSAQKMACVKQTRAAKQACVLGCALTGRGGGCVRSCLRTFLEAKEACREDQVDCVRDCVPPPPGPAQRACRGTCGQRLAACVKDVAMRAQSCARNCRTADDRLGCMRTCQSTARADGAGCRADFKACVGSCGGSAEGAFPGPEPASF